jgi:alkylhydroperoxidase family enzyme
MTTERFGSLSPDDWSERQRQLADVHSGGSPAAVSSAILRHEELFDRWMPFLQYLMQHGRLPAPDRELLILRTAANCNCTYQQERHVRHATTAGLSAEEIARVPLGPGAPEWDAWQRTLLQAADDLCDHARISDDRWRQLAARYDDAQIIECLAVVGHYQMLGGLTNSLDFTT